MSLQPRINSHFTEAADVLHRFNADPANFVKIEYAGDLMVKTLEAGGKILACGNGGSHCDAMHFAEELTGRYRDDRKPFAALAISDSSHITCVGNDYGFEQVYSRFIDGLGREGDVLLAISTSGNSENVIAAAKAARNLGMHVVALTGNDGGNLAAIANVEIRVPYHGYADRIQEIHIKIIHALIDYIESKMD